MSSLGFRQETHEDHELACRRRTSAARVVLVLAMLAGCGEGAGAKSERLMAATSEACDVDLVGQVSSDITLVELEDQTRARFTVGIENAGCAQVAGVVRLKPFLLPDDSDGSAIDDAGQYVDGRVLPSVDYAVTLSAGEIVDVQYEERLPKLPRATWRLAVVIDSNDIVSESNERNNVTELVDAGRFRVRHKNRDTSQQLDLYTEIEGDIVIAEGGADHTLRTIRRHRGRIRNRDLWARFMAVGAGDSHVHTLPYAESQDETEKQWYWLMWNREYDEEARAIWVDYYWQAPLLEGVPPGNYRFLTLTDSHDLVPEIDEANNLDVHPFVATVVDLVGYPDTWFVSSETEPPDEEDMTFRNTTGEWINWSIETRAEAGWLEVEPASGSLGPGQEATVRLTADVGSLPEGKHTADIRLLAYGYDSFAVTLPAYLYIHGADSSPLNDTRPRSLSFETQMDHEHGHPEHPEPQVVTIANPGTGKLEWAMWQDVTWITTAPTSGSVDPGEVVDVSVIVHPEHAEIGHHEGRIVVFCNATNDHPVVDVTLDVHD